MAVLCNYPKQAVILTHATDDAESNIQSRSAYHSDTQDTPLLTNARPCRKREEKNTVYFNATQFIKLIQPVYKTRDVLSHTIALV
jgi:hypothetical protein